MSQPFNNSSFDSQYRRIFEAAECNFQVELADFLKIRQFSISDAKRRQRTPSGWLVKLFTKKRINPEWILLGEGGEYLTPTDAEPRPYVVRVTEIRSPMECSVQELSPKWYSGLWSLLIVRRFKRKSPHLASHEKAGG